MMFDSIPWSPASKPPLRNIPEHPDKGLAAPLLHFISLLLTESSEGHRPIDCIKSFCSAELQIFSILIPSGVNRNQEIVFEHYACLGLLRVYDQISNRKLQKCCEEKEMKAESTAAVKRIGYSMRFL